MNKYVIGAASCYKEKYYSNPEFSDIPKDVQDDIKILCVTYSKMLHCVFIMGFCEDGSLYFEAQAEENDFTYDQIGAALEIDIIKTERKELINALGLWYVVFKTNEGKVIQQELLRGSGEI